nr:HAD hydrolase family protein [Pelosinus baikalensis]
MGNAPEEVKDCVNAITLSNDEDGVVFAINKYIL